MIDDLVALICKLRCRPPRPLAIWFVDRPAEYYQLLKVTDVTVEPHCLLPVRLYDLPLRQFTIHAATEKELAVRPFFCQIPGIWIEMSNGNHACLVEIPDEDSAHHHNGRDGPQSQIQGIEDGSD